MLIKNSLFFAQVGNRGSNFVGSLPLTSFVFLSSLKYRQRCRRIEMESPSKSHRVRDFLPSVKPSYLSLILVLVCGMIFIRNESTNDRLKVLEKQMKILTASKSSVDIGSPSNEDFDRK